MFSPDGHSVPPPSLISSNFQSFSSPDEVVSASLPDHCFREISFVLPRRNATFGDLDTPNAV